MCVGSGSTTKLKVDERSAAKQIDIFKRIFMTVELQMKLLQFRKLCAKGAVRPKRNAGDGWHGREGDIIS
jgi:hypothetical protein